MRLSEIIGLKVNAESGERLGRVHDVRAEFGPSSLRVTGLVVGKLGVLERLGLGAPGSLARTGSRDVVPWAAVIRLDRRGVIVRDKTDSE